MWSHQAKAMTWVYVINCGNVQTAGSIKHQTPGNNHFHSKLHTHKWLLLLGGSTFDDIATSPLFGETHINTYHTFYVWMSLQACQVLERIGEPHQTIDDFTALDGKIKVTQVSSMSTSWLPVSWTCVFDYVIFY